MALWAERQVKRDLGIVVHSGKPQSFDKLFETPPHVEYIAREAKTAARLRRLMGTNVVELSNCVFMEQLEQQTLRAYREDLQERMDERAHQAAELAHLQLWESVLLGRSTIPPEKLEDPCMRQVREHQLKIEGLHDMAIKFGTTVQRVAAMPHVWSEPSRYRPPKKRKERSQSWSPEPEGSEASRPQKVSRRPSQRSKRSGGTTATKTSLALRSIKTIARPDSWISRKMVIKMSEEAREKRIRGLGSKASPRRGLQYRHLKGDPDAKSYSGPEKEKKAVSLEEEEFPPPRRDRRSSRVNPPRRAPVVFPDESPPFVLLSWGADTGRSVMRPLGSTDFIIPRYYRPKAPKLLHAAKNLDELYNTGNSMFDTPYPNMDSRNWAAVQEARAAKKEHQQIVSPAAHIFR